MFWGRAEVKRRQTAYGSPQGVHGESINKINGREVKITEGQLYRSSQNEPQIEKDSSTSSLSGLENSRS